MNNKERVMACLAHKQPDRIPYQISYTQQARAKMKEHFGESGAWSQLNNSFWPLGTGLPGSAKEVQPGIWQDEFGVQRDMSMDQDIGTVCNTVVTPQNVANYQFPDPRDPARFEHFGKVVGNYPHVFFYAAIGGSLFERAWALAGMATILASMLADPDFVNTLLDKIVDYNLGLIECACAYDISGVWFGDDWGQQTGMLMGPELWRECLKPRLRRMYDAVKASGKHVLIHCCGKVQEIFPDLIEIGLDVFNPFQPEVMDVYAMKKEYGNDLCFWGGISTQRLLPYGTVQEVKDEVRRLLDSVGRDGGYIASPAHTIPGDARPENIMAMLEVLNDQ